MPCFCPSCRRRVPEKSDSISCDYCLRWFHLRCTDLTSSQFEIFTKQKSFEWVCNHCAENICQKCNILTKNSTKIQCEKCEKKFHLICAGLSKTAYIPTTSWYCYQCHEELFPFNSISVKQVCNLAFNSLKLNTHPNQIHSIHSNYSQNTKTEFKCICNVCSKNINQPNSAIPCPSCQCLIHKKCTKLAQKEIDHFRNHPNVWECSTCLNSKFPLMDAEDIEITMDSFNSNWKCLCKAKTQKFPPVPTGKEYQLTLNNHHDNDYKYQDIYLEDFDINFNMYHSMKPDFKYYETHEFDAMK